MCEGAASRWKNGDTCDHYMHKTAQIKSFTGTAVDQSLGLSLEVGAALESGSFDCYFILLGWVFMIPLDKKILDFLDSGFWTLDFLPDEGDGELPMIA